MNRPNRIPSPTFSKMARQAVPKLPTTPTGKTGSYCRKKIWKKSRKFSSTRAVIHSLRPCQPTMYGAKEPRYRAGAALR